MPIISPTPQLLPLHPNSFLCAVLLAVAVAVVVAEYSASTPNECNREDLSALLSFKEHIGSSWSLYSWNLSVSCCDWEGITCDGSLPRRVWRLSLEGRGFKATIPPALGSLNLLQACNLSYNSFYGYLPQELGSLSHIQLLDLSNNNLTGPLTALAKLSKARAFKVSSNFFVGSLPALKSLTSLVDLSASNNSLFGKVPTDVCLHAQNLRTFDLSCNNFTGHLELGLGSCTQLEVLDVSGNSLTGPLPSDLFQLRALTRLQLTKNNFTGTVDEAVGNLTNLSYLMLGFNNFSGELPANLSACSKLKVFTANGNRLKGPIANVEFGNMPELEIVDINSNSFTGSIPSSLERCTALQSLNMAKNKLTGVIPHGFNSLRNLATLLLSSNRLSGSLSSLTDNIQLVSLILSKNVFQEKIPDEIKGLSNLQVLALGNLNLSGTIPSWLKDCHKLQVLDLSWNHLSGSLPNWLGNFPHLFYLDLSNNSLTGIIPSKLMDLPTLAQGDMNMTGLQSVVSNLAIRQKVDSPELQYTQVSAFPPTLYLSHNMLGGSIPAEIGNLKKLLNLDLSFNNLSGSIPEPMGNLLGLESLDLSRNKLSGSIPPCLEKLTFLAYFNVSYNELVGPIPAGYQFLTFSNKSYQGNAGLCGAPLPACSKNSLGPPLVAFVHKRNPSTSRIAVLLPISLVIGSIATLVGWVSWKLSRRNVVYQGNVSFKDIDGPQCLMEALNFSVELFYKHGKLTVFDLFKATNNFDAANIVGCGGFGLVYRADLADGSRLAIKKLTGDCGQMEREFRAEVETLSKAQHKNLVPLQGYLQVGNDRLLMYSYMENGSLDYWLHERSDGGTCVDWPMRLKIARGAAHGLAYLHQICEPHIVHRDIKSSNILLDEKFEAHLADFGLARLMMSADTHVTTEVVGTLGYIPPEYCHALNATPRGDVYSFGVVLLELLTRRRPVDVCKGRGASDLVAWVLQRRTSGKPEEIFDPVLRSKGYEEQMLQMLDVACPCINPDPMKRPTITDIVVWLDRIGQDNVSVKSLA